MTQTTNSQQKTTQNHQLPIPVRNHVCDTNTIVFLLHSLHVLSDECGIVAQISQPLADSDISAYYISTFSFDHALVSPASSRH